MGWRFRRSVRIMPGVRVNFGKRGTSLSVGGHGVTTTYGPSGVHTTYSIPGTGISYRQRVSGPPAKVAPATRAQPAAVQSGVYSGQLLPDGSVIYVDANGVEASPAAVREIRRQGRDTILAWLEENAKERNAQVHPLLSVHYGTPPPMDIVHYRPPAFPSPEPPPPVYEEPPPLAPPVLEQPNWFAARIPFLRRRVEARNCRRQAEYTTAQQDWTSKEQQAQAAYAQAELSWEADVTTWEAALAAFDADQMERQRMLTAPEPADFSAIADMLRRQLAAIPWPRPVDASVTVTGRGDTVSISAHVPSVSDPQAQWPMCVATVHHERLRLYTKEKLKRDIRAEFCVHVQSVAFRLAGEVFGMFPAAGTVMVEVLAKDNVMGKTKPEVRLVVTRAQWSALNFAQLQHFDLTRALAPFRC